MDPGRVEGGGSEVSQGGGGGRGLGVTQGGMEGGALG